MIEAGDKAQINTLTLTLCLEQINFPIFPWHYRQEP